LNFATVICTALMLWKGLAVALNTESPVVVVLSGSMEPGFYRGDLLFLSLPRDRQLKIGEIPVFNVPEGKIPIVHRLIENHDEPLSTKKQNAAGGDQQPTRWMLTKGDNNHENDVALYNGLKYLQRSNLIGKVNGYVPHVGYVTIVMVGLTFSIKSSLVFYFAQIDSPSLTYIFVFSP
jgi:signal peptidase